LQTDDEWESLRYVIFDAPDQRGPFEDRLSHIYQLAKDIGNRYVSAHAHEVCSGPAHLQKELSRIEAAGMYVALYVVETGNDDVFLKMILSHRW
jgi:hypothetical protein